MSASGSSSCTSIWENCRPCSGLIRMTFRSRKIQSGVYPTCRERRVLKNSHHSFIKLCSVYYRAINTDLEIRNYRLKTEEQSEGMIINTTDKRPALYLNFYSKTEHHFNVTRNEPTFFAYSTIFWNWPVSAKHCITLLGTFALK